MSGTAPDGGVSIWLVEISAHDGSAEIVHRFASGGYVTRPSDDPANAHYQPLVVQPADYERHAFGPGRTFGRSEATPGEILLMNPDGRLDGLRGQGFDGRQVRIRRVPAGAPYTASAVVQTGTMREPLFGWARVTVRLRDKAELFDVPACPALFEGDAVGPLHVASFVGREDLSGFAPAFDFSRASGQTYLHGDGSMSSVGVDEPAIGDRGLFIEAEETNRALDGADASGATGWTGSTVVVSANAATAPDGTTTADAVTDNSAVAALVLLQTRGVGAALNDWWSGSIFVDKAASAPAVLMEISAGFTGTGTTSWRWAFDPFTGDALLRESAADRTILTVEDAGPRWRVHVAVRNSSAVQASMRFFLYPSRYATLSGAADVALTGSAIVWGAQMSAGQRSGSYIPTTSGAATRAASVAVWDLPDGNYDVLIERESGRAWLDVTVSGGAGWTLPTDHSPIRSIQVYADDALDAAAKTALEAGGIGAGLGGGAELKGTRKPRVLGRVLQIRPTLLNAFSLAYGVSWDEAGDPEAVASIDGVYDRGAPLDPGADHATPADLLAATVEAGHYDTCLAAGLIRLGSPPDGIVTADVTRGAAPADRTAARLMEALTRGPGGLSAEEVDADALDGLDAANDAELGIWLTGEVTIAEALDAIAGSVGAWWIFDRMGVFVTCRLEAPAGPAAVTIGPEALIDQGQAIELLPPGDEGEGVPAWRVSVRHARHWTVQAEDALAEGLTAERRAALGQEWRTAFAEDPAVKVKHLKAPELAFDTLLTDAGEAQAEAGRQLALRGVERIRARLRCPERRAGGLDIGDTVRVRAPRFGLDAGQDFAVIGLGRIGTRSIVTLELWG